MYYTPVHVSPMSYVYTGGIPQRWNSGCDLHCCHTAVHTNLTAVTIVLFTVPERKPRFLHETEAKVEFAQLEKCK